MARQPALAEGREDGLAGALPSPGWPPHTAAVMQLRADRGYVTPLRPIEEGDAYCVCAYPGMWEWLFHPDDAARYLATGIIVDGLPCKVEQVGDYPLMGAVQIRASHIDRTRSWVEERDAA